ncbi:FAD-dependent oxidoreductase [Microbacterium sp. CH12i]|uniref:FAD-dependent oxidoreductase n=1 Tax=Microbacterium sp. CH12i TaxID=1479651 RepID=UPI00068B03CC|nr:NAD(P)/FAD-dependent oxidoreductase [Microbacterium sp. CH12i]
MPHHDVAIVGAGPVGLLLACLLAQEGIDVVVYENRTGADDRSRAIGIHPPGLAALDAVNLGAQVREEALELEGGEVLCGGRTLASIAFSAKQRVLILPQRRTHALLVERIGQLPSATLCTGHEVRELRNEGDLLCLAVHTDSAHRADTASFVIAADGVRSGIRSQLGIGWRQQSGRGSYAMVDIPDAQNFPRAQLYCEPAGLVESFPLPLGGRRWVAADPERALGDAEAFARVIWERTGIRIDMPAGLQPTAFQARQHRAARTVGGRVVLLGDAAHETSPIGGQGMNLGWAAALHLAVVLEQSLRDDLPDFRAYERVTRRAAVRAQRRSSFYMAMGHPAEGFGLEPPQHGDQSARDSAASSAHGEHDHHAGRDPADTVLERRLIGGHHCALGRRAVYASVEGRRTISAPGSVRTRTLSVPMRSPSA